MVAKRKSKKQDNISIRQMVVGVIIAVFVAFVALLAYSAYIFQSSNQEEKGFFVCNDERTECRLSQHIHSEIVANVCGNELTFPRETGRTDEMHTHKERNFMHWHSPINVDPETHEPIGEERYRVTTQAFFDQMGFEFPEACPNNPNPELTVHVNEELNEDGLDYVWVDGDDVVIDYN